MIHVPPGDSVLTAALAAGVLLPYSCRAGRCATCKAKVLSGRFEYPFPPPGISAAESAAGEVLLCQARPLTDLRVQSRRTVVRAAHAVTTEIVALTRVALDALTVTLRIVEGPFAARPGQYVDVRNHAGDSERLPLVAVRPGELAVESAADGGVLHAWLATEAVPGTRLRVAGPFDAVR